jgi:alcohol dehydrogenase
MRAVVYTGSAAVRVEEVEEPRLLQPTDALVRVTLAGICGTDLHLIAGHFHGLEPGSVIGHEFVGDVIEIGSAVQHIARGDHVMASDFAACGRCRWCDRGDHWECDDRAFFGTGRAFGRDLAGAQAEIVRVPHADTTLMRVPRGFSDEAALLVGDNLATGWVAIERGRLAPGDSVAIIGGGAVGQLTSLSAQASGAGAVIVIEPNARRRAFAEAHGALAASPEEADDLVRRTTGGDGVDIAVDAVGGGDPLRSAMNLVRKRGQVVSVGAHSGKTWPLPIERSFSEELSLTFAIGDSIRLRRRLISLITSRVLDPTGIIDGRVALGDVQAVYENLAAQRILKAVIDLRR